MNNNQKVYLNYNFYLQICLLNKNFDYYILLLLILVYYFFLIYLRKYIYIHFYLNAKNTFCLCIFKINAYLLIITFTIY